MLFWEQFIFNSDLPWTYKTADEVEFNCVEMDCFPCICFINIDVTNRTSIVRPPAR